MPRTSTQTSTSFAGGITTTSASFGIRTVTVAANVLATDFTILADMTSGSYSVTLPVSPAPGMVVNIKKITTDTNTLTIARNGNNINGAAADATTAATTQPNFQLEFQTGTGWWQL